MFMLAIPAIKNTSNAAVADWKFLLLPHHHHYQETPLNAFQLVYFPVTH